MKPRRSVSAGLLWAALATSTSAGELDKITIHGFVSQSFLKTEDNVFLSLEKSPKGTFAFTEEALNFTANPSDKLRIGAQLIGRDVGPQGNHKISADWALGDYRFRDEFGVRAGKVKLSTGLYNSVMDADVARPEALQPESVYPINQRDFRNAMNGVQLYGTLRLGKAGYLDYEAWSGTVDLDDAYIVHRVAKDTALQLLPAFQFAGLRGANYRVEGTEGNLDTFFGGTLEWRPPVAGLRLRSTLTEADAFFSSALTFSGTQGPLPVSLPVDVATHYDQRYQLYLSAEYQREGLRVSAEDWSSKGYVDTTISGIPGSGPVSSSSLQRGSGRYLQVVYRFDPRFQAGAYYSVYYPDRDDKEGKKLVLTGQPAFRAWQKDLTVHLRCDVTSNFLLKAEAHFINGAASLSTSDNPQGFKKDWKMFVARATFHF